MNHKDRVISAIKHHPVDRAPYDFWAEDATLERIYKSAGHRDFDKLLVDLDVDIRHINAVTPAEKDCGDYLENFWGERYVYKKTEWGPVREDIPGALSKAESLEDLKKFNWPSTKMFDYSKIAQLCEAYGDYAVLYGFADIWERPALTRGMENALLDLAINPDWVRFLSKKYTEFYKEDYTKAQKAAGGKINIFLVISDLGGQNAPIMSMDMFNEFIAPYLKEMADRVHELGAYIMLHSCGMIYPFIERLIELGVDILDPIQPVHPDMSPENLSAHFSGRICFHGGIDIQNLLPFGTPEQVENEVRRYAGQFAKSGGYISAPSHLFQPDTPPENIFAFYNALKESSLH